MGNEFFGISIVNRFMKKYEKYVFTSNDDVQIDLCSAVIIDLGLSSWTRFSIHEPIVSFVC